MYCIKTDIDNMYGIVHMYEPRYASYSEIKIKIKTGLNIFNIKNACEHGFIIYYVKNILENNDSHNNIYIRSVIMPPDANITKYEYDKEIGLYFVLSDKIIVNDYRYFLCDKNTLIKFDINLSLSKGLNSYINCLAYNGVVDVLEWLKNKRLLLECSTYCMENASCNGHIGVLEWWKNSGLILKYSKRELSMASMSGHVNVLEWWKNSGLPIVYEECPINSIISSCDVLDWWFNSGLPLEYTEKALDWASWTGRVHILEWWKNSGLELKYNEKALNEASRGGHIDVLEWWKNSGLELKYSNYALDYYDISVERLIEVLYWWKHSGLPMFKSSDVEKKVLGSIKKKNSKNVKILELLQNY